MPERSAAELVGVPPDVEGTLGGRGGDPGRCGAARPAERVVPADEDADEEVVEPVPLDPVPLDPVEPVLSAKAIVGIEARAAPIPSATASAPIRPT